MVHMTRVPFWMSILKQTFEENVEKNNLKNLNFSLEIALRTFEVEDWNQMQFQAAICRNERLLVFLEKSNLYSGRPLYNLRKVNNYIEEMLLKNKSNVSRFEILTPMKILLNEAKAWSDRTRKDIDMEVVDADAPATMVLKSGTKQCELWSEYATAMSIKSAMESSYKAVNVLGSTEAVGARNSAICAVDAHVWNVAAHFWRMWVTEKACFAKFKAERSIAWQNEIDSLANIALGFDGRIEIEDSDDSEI